MEGLKSHGQRLDVQDLCLGGCADPELNERTGLHRWLSDVSTYSAHIVAQDLEVDILEMYGLVESVLELQYNVSLRHGAFTDLFSYKGIHL